MPNTPTDTTQTTNNSTPPALTILHTSDWHLGRRLYGQQRYAEFEAFLAWLTDTIEQQQVDVVIVAGDIFDTMTPSNKAQALYYEFLGKISQLHCQHVVIVAGNHDSPTFLDAPKTALKYLNVHIIGTACEDPRDEVLTLMDNQGNPYCIVTAVPYLRDRDVRGSIAGESSSDKDANVIAGIQAHYQQVAEHAKSIQSKLIANHQCHIPIIATGHLFTVGGKTTDDDGVRDLYVGTLGQVSASIFDDCFDYVALGHLHVPQKVGGCEHIRYSGSPIAMGFGEARQQKQVLLVRFTHIDVKNQTDKQITPIAVPCFQPMAQISGTLEQIEEKIHHAVTTLCHTENNTQNRTLWLEVIYTGQEVVSDLREHIQSIICDLPCEVLKIKNTSTYNKVLQQQSDDETLQDLDEREVFERCLDTYQVPDSQKPTLRQAYEQILHTLQQQDSQAE
ncbi:exonuclease SbcCD subunit D C-terminal domain-containing protein [Psychrobacter sp. I-STPA10]|uniref:exonuclease SbcCD subunit D C-terminal domain-containing protein n=1 Tax=Psychrobacter sp. I-STPA10 TaxID=2585769 RepID=UPI001E35ED26|nr:exonuclease SbcCD subunit D C-terminal domain-containing protein [Psychrobacter sp. I-STPA10]